MIVLVFGVVAGLDVAVATSIADSMIIVPPPPPRTPLGLRLSGDAMFRRFDISTFRGFDVLTFRLTAIPLPRHLYGEERLNSSGVNLASELEQRTLAFAMQPFARTRWEVEPLLAGGSREKGPVLPIVNPARLADAVGQVRQASKSEVVQAIADARAYIGIMTRRAGASGRVARSRRTNKAYRTCAFGCWWSKT